MILDLIFLIVVVYGFYLGFTPKYTSWFSMVILTVTSLILAMNIAPYVTDFLASNARMDSGLIFFITLIFSFLMSVMIVKLLMGYSESMVKKDNMNLAANLSSGLVISALLLIVYGMALYVGEETNIIHKNLRKESVTYNFTRSFPSEAKASVASVKPAFDDFWEYLSDGMNDNYKHSKKRGR